MTSTPRLAIPLLAPGQAQKELFHNEALQLLDIAVAANVEEPPRASPPEAPSIGSCYIVGSGATGAWAGRDWAIAGFTPGGWRFVEPPIGMSVNVASNGTRADFGASGWITGTVRCEKLVIAGNQVVGGRSGAVADPSGGATIDAEARAAVQQILSALRQHGLIAS